MSKFYFYCVIAGNLDPHDVHISNQIAGALKTIFHAVRQFANRNNTARDNLKGKDFKLGRGDGEISVPVETMEERWRAALQTEKLGINETDPSYTPLGKWTGVMAPYVAYCFGFNLRMKELRLGHHGYSVSTRPGAEERNADGMGRVSKFGLEPRHHVLLEGCTFPPEI